MAFVNSLTTRSHSPGIAPGYKQALHELCIICHRDHEQAKGVTEPYLTRCGACHREQFADEDEMRRRAGWPPPNAEEPLQARARLVRAGAASESAHLEEASP